MDEIRTHTILNNRYEVQRELGRGGMGAVYLAQDLRYRKPVAIKVARLAHPEARAQFRREADYLQKLHHHSLPRVWDTFSDTQRDFLVMEYIPGDDLETLVQRKGAQPEWQVLRWADELLDGLAFLHTQSPPIIHRDIKPGNLKLRGDGTLVLVDFGIAKEYLPGVNTVAGATAVTPGFSPPEQYSDSLTDARSDLYSVGATMYFLLTGVAPAPAPARASGDQKLLPPSQLVASISTGAEMVVRKALSLPRDQRWANAAEMRQMVDQAAQRLATRPEAGRKAPPPAGRSQAAPARGRAQPWPLLLGLFVGIVAVVALVAFLLSRPGSDPTAAATPPATTSAATNPTATVAAATPTPAPATATPAPATPTPAGDEAAQAAPAASQPTLPPTSTPIATRTSVATRPPIATPVRPAATVPPAPAAPPASPAAAANLAVALLEPGDGDTREREVTFRWSVTGGSLAAGQSFEIFFYRPGEDPLAGFGLAAPTSGNAVTVDLPGLDAAAGSPLDPGTYLWSVRLVQGGRPVRALAEGRRLVYQRPSQPQQPPPAPPTEEPTPTPTLIP